MTEAKISLKNGVPCFLVKSQAANKYRLLKASKQSGIYVLMVRDSARSVFTSRTAAAHEQQQESTRKAKRVEKMNTHLQYETIRP